jgi:pyrimidine operon attenuation protein/uracil phosphoribosyltransferase
MQVLFSATEVDEIISGLVQQLSKDHEGMQDVVYIGIQQGGVVVADKIVSGLQKNNSTAIQYGQLDITFYRDDIRKEILAPDKMNLPFSIENKIVILIDDVLFTGRTIKAALDVLLDYGRPAKVELCVLIDRKEHRQFPIQADYVGKFVQTGRMDKVKISDGRVVLITNQ